LRNVSEATLGIAKRSDKEIIVNEKSMRNKKKRLGCQIKILLGVLVLVGLGSAGYAVAAGDEPELEWMQPDLIHVFDPFLLTSTPTAAAEAGGAGSVNSGDIVILDDRPPIRIPPRPALRSPFRPPLF
jgi:hypothetical protein